MHNIITPSQLLSRLQAINLAPTELARAADIHHTTLLRMINGGNCEMDTLKTVSSALLSEERRIQAYLNLLHPAQEGEAA
jgi:predicted transcriptional regulator